MQYTDIPPPPSAKDVRKKNLKVGGGTEPPEPFALQTARKNAPVTLYSSPDCGDWCDRARALLNQRGVPFKEVSVVSADQAEALRKLTGANTVPTMTVGHSVQKGFLETGYQHALDAAGYPAPGLLKPRDQKAPPPPKPEDSQPAAGAPQAGHAPASELPAPPRTQ